MNAVGRQMAADRGADPGAAKSVALAEACDVACDGEAPRRFGAWVSAIGSTGSVLGDNNAAGLTYTFGGTAFGIDYRLDPSFLVGLAGGYVTGTQWVNGFTGNGYADVFNVALYASFHPGRLLRRCAGGLRQCAATACSASINTPGLPTGITNGSASANQFIGQIETGYRIGLDFPARTSVSPFGRLQIGASNQAGFTECGTSLYNLTVASQTTTSVRSTLGVDLAAGFDLGGGPPLDLGLRLGWMHEYADTGRPMTAAFAAAPGGQFTAFGATPQRDSAVLGVSAVAAINERTSAFLNYDGEVGGGTDNHAAGWASGCNLVGSSSVEQYLGCTPSARITSAIRELSSPARSPRRGGEAGARSMACRTPPRASRWVTVMAPVLPSILTWPKWQEPSDGARSKRPAGGGVLEHDLGAEGLVEPLGPKPPAQSGPETNS